jgi:hypothetical protein
MGCLLILVGAEFYRKSGPSGRIAENRAKNSDGPQKAVAWKVWF